MISPCLFESCNNNNIDYYDNEREVKLQYKLSEVLLYYILFSKRKSESENKSESNDNSIYVQTNKKQVYQKQVYSINNQQCASTIVYNDNSEPIYIHCTV